MAESIEYIISLKDQFSGNIKTALEGLEGVKSSVNSINPAIKSISGSLSKLGADGSKQLQNLSGFADTFKTNMKGMKPSVGSVLDGLGNIGDSSIDTLKSLGGFADNAIKGMGKIGKSVDTVIPGFSDMAKGVLENSGAMEAYDTVRNTVQAGMTAYQGVVDTVKAASEAWQVVQAALNLVMSLNPISLIVLAIAALIAGIILAYQNSETFRNLVDALWEALKKVGMFIWDTLIGAFDAMKEAFERIKPKLLEFWETIKGVFSKAWEFIKKYHPISLLVNLIDMIFPGFKKKLGAIWDSLVDWLLDLWNGVKEFFSGLTDLFSSDDGETKEINIKEKIERDDSEREDEESEVSKAALGGPGPGEETDATSAAAGGSMGSGVDSTYSGGGGSSGGAGSSGSIYIEKLVETFNINTNSIEEGSDQLREKIIEVLTRAVNDVQVTTS